MTLLKSLTHRPFALLWAGQTTSRLGDSLYRIAMAWWVLEKTGSAAAMSAVLIFTSVPMLIFLLIGGVFTDRFPRLRVMLYSDILCGAVVSVVAILAFAGSLEVWHIYIASILFGLVKAFFSPAYTATVPEITPIEMLPSANSLTSLSQQGANILGPALGASVVALGGTPLAFALDAVSFFISTACIFLIFRSHPNLNLAPTAPEQAAVGAPTPAIHGIRSIFADIREGYLAVIASPWLWITIALFALVNATSGAPMAVSLPLFVKENLNKGVGVLGLFTSMSSAGYVIGALWMGHFTRIRHRGPFAYLATLFSGVAVLIFGLTANVPALAAASFLNGVCMAVFSLIWTNLLQELVPRHLLGRVSSIDALGSYVLLPIGFGIAGWATDLVSAPVVFAIGGSITIVLVLLGASHPAIRALN